MSLFNYLDADSAQLESICANKQVCQRHCDLGSEFLIKIDEPYKLCIVANAAF